MRIFLIISAFVLVKCHNPTDRSSNEQVMVEYFETYAEREDWEGFLSFYSDSLHFKDIILGEDLKGKISFAEFYNWPDTGFVKHPDYPKILSIERLTVDGDYAVAQGRLKPFYWYGDYFGMENSGEFVMWFKLNPAGKIVEQTDWINYPHAILQSIFCQSLKDEN